MTAVRPMGSIRPLFRFVEWCSDLLGFGKYEQLAARRTTAGQAVLDEASERLGETTLVEITVTGH